MKKSPKFASTQDKNTTVTRRSALRHLASFAAASPLVGQSQASQQRERPEPIYPPAYSDEIMAPVNLHEIEAVARQKINKLAYDYIAGGAADEQTLRANREAFGRFWIRGRRMKDVSAMDTSLDLLGQELEHPLLLAPAGAKQILHPDGDRVAARAARHTKSIYVVSALDTMNELSQVGEAPTWWAATFGQATQTSAVEFAKRAEDSGASAICVSVDYPYMGIRDRDSRNEFDMESIQTGIYSTSEPPQNSFQTGMLQPYTPSMTWKYLGWLHSATQLPIVVKGIVTGEDTRLSVEHGAQAVIVSNHGGRSLDGMVGSLEALPEVVDAVNGRVPILMDGGIRRGGDVLKALGLGATAVLIGRPYMWGLAAFGQEGVQRVVELLRGELMVAMGLAGMANLGAIQRNLIRRAWTP